LFYVLPWFSLGKPTGLTITVSKKIGGLMVILFGLFAVLSAQDIAITTSGSHNFSVPFEAGLNLTLVCDDVSVFVA